MDLSYFTENENSTVAQVKEKLAKIQAKPETIVVVNSENQLTGIVNTKNLLIAEDFTELKDIPKHHHFVFENARFSDIFKIFAEYNLRTLPVINAERLVIGLIKIDTVLARIQQEEEKDETL